jgi:hypothetical protein
MQLIRRFVAVSIPALALVGVSFGVGATGAFADEKELSLRGLVDCGRKVEQSCNIKDSFFFWTDGYGEGTQRVKIDVTWVKPEQIPSIDQEDELCLTGFVREDQVYQATAINEECDEGTVNDKDAEREKKENSKERNRD